MSLNSAHPSGPYDLPIDLSTLSWLEQHWVAWYIYIDNPVLATGMMTFLLSGSSTQWQKLSACKPTKSLSPPFKPCPPQIVLFFIFEDIFHHFAYQALHYGPLYWHIHKIHHRYSAPFGLAAEYAHPAEVAILGTGTIAGPILYCYATANLHVLTVYIWMALCLFQATDAHSGYGELIPLSSRNDLIHSSTPCRRLPLVPFWSSADHHDFHHMAFTNKFSTSFRWCDRFFGTDDKYRAYYKRVKEMRSKGATKEACESMERKLMAEVEAEGG
ncbi:C4-methyl sterol oxidase [Mycena venus]|uniref:C4-methyl sterol oxidase n=1 Tax=Mycena venus TaxID=2733690 RepID=A0A8H7CHN2_9AGAR|nr:C4-methyl sterol oxidase [Mycena venus]